MWRRANLVWITLLAGCGFKASYDGTHYQCGADGSCPSGQTCVADVCVIGESPDAHVGVDAPPGTPDAPSDAALAQGLCGSLALLRDDFATDKLGTIWDSWSDGGPTATVTGGHLAIAIPQNNQDLGAGYASSYYYDFTGSVAEAAVSQVASTDTILEVRGIGGKKIQMVLESGVLSAWDGADKAQVTYDPLVHKRWRLREDGGTTYWEWSTDGATWTELFHETDRFPPDHVIVELSADGNDASTAVFEEINVDTPQPPGFCGSSTLTDDFVTQLAPLWSSWADGGNTIAETGGAVVITTDGVGGNYCGLETNHLYDLRDDAIYVDASTVPMTTGFVTWAQAMVPGDGETRLEFNVEANQLQMLQKIASTNVDSKSITYDPAAHRFWRFRVAGTTVYFETSPDGATWTAQLQATAKIDLSALHFVFGAGEYKTLSTTTAKFGSVNLP